MKPDGSILAQGKKRALTPTKDNAGFAAWVDKNKSLLESLRHPEQTNVLFGEWCGPGVQADVAVSHIDRKIFCPFAFLQFAQNPIHATVDVEPNSIRARLPEHPDIFVLPWHGPSVEFDFSDAKKLEASSETINARVESIEVHDPFVYEEFGVEGAGEGVVMYPLLGQSDQLVDFVRCTSLMFKAKGVRHRVRKQKKAAMTAPSLPRSVKAFVSVYATSARDGYPLIQSYSVHQIHVDRMRKRALPS